MVTSSQRRHVRSLLDELWALRAGLLYPSADVRTSADARGWQASEATALRWLRTGGTVTFDCSEQDAWVLAKAGIWLLPQPGYTGSHLLLPQYLDGRLAKVGAIVVFGPGSGHHEALVYEPDPVHGDPLCQEHGQPGEARNRVSAIRARQAAEGYVSEPRYCSIAHLG